MSFQFRLVLFISNHVLSTVNKKTNTDTCFLSPKYFYIAYIGNELDSFSLPCAFNQALIGERWLTIISQKYCTLEIKCGLSPFILPAISDSISPFCRLSCSPLCSMEGLWPLFYYTVSSWHKSQDVIRLYAFSENLRNSRVHLLCWPDRQQGIVTSFTQRWVFMFSMYCMFSFFLISLPLAAREHGSSWDCWVWLLRREWDRELMRYSEILANST